MTLEHPGLRLNLVSLRISTWPSPRSSILYTADISSRFAKHLATGHLYADDVQACVHGSPTAQLSLITRIDALSQDLHAWMSSNRLSLNPTKTKLIWFGTRQQLAKIDYSLLDENFLPMPFQPLFVTWVSLLIALSPSLATLIISPAPAITISDA